MEDNMKKAFFGVLAVLLLFLTGCSKNPYVGIWSVQLDPQIEQMARQANQPIPTGELRFTDDKKFTWTLNVGPTNLKIEGTYKIDEKESKNIQITTTKVEGTPDAPPPQQTINGTLSEDGKTLTLAGVPIKFVKKE
jgi:hypothetical protein